MVAQAHHFAGGDHERVPRVQWPALVAEVKAAGPVLDVGENEEVVGVRVIAGGVGDGKVVCVEAQHADRRRTGCPDVLVDRSAVDPATGQPGRPGWHQRSLYFRQRFALFPRHRVHYY